MSKSQFIKDAQDDYYGFLNSLDSKEGKPKLTICAVSPWIPVSEQEPPKGEKELLVKIQGGSTWVSDCFEGYWKNFRNEPPGLYQEIPFTHYMEIPE